MPSVNGGCYCRSKTIFRLFAAAWDMHLRASMQRLAGDLFGITHQCGTASILRHRQRSAACQPQPVITLTQTSIITWGGLADGGCPWSAQFGTSRRCRRSNCRVHVNTAGAVARPRSTVIMTREASMSPGAGYRMQPGKPRSFMTSKMPTSTKAPSANLEAPVLCQRSFLYCEAAD